VGAAFDAKSTNAASDCGKLDGALCGKLATAEPLCGKLATAEPLCGKLATAEPLCGKLASAGPENGADCGELDTAGALLEKLLPADWKKESDWLPLLLADWKLLLLLLLLAGWKLAKEGAALA
jgi:hypothetical protein